MFARVKLIPTATKRAERYFEGIFQRGSLYDADVDDIPVSVIDLEQYTIAGTSDTEGSSFEPSDTEGSDSNGRHIRPARTRRDRRYTELMDVLRELQKEMQKSNEKRDQQHQKLLDLIRGLQGSTSYARARGTWFDDPPFDDEDGHRDFNPRGRICSHQGDQQGPGVTTREEVTRGTSGTDTTPIEIEQEPQQHTPPVDPSAKHHFIHSTRTEIPSLRAPKELTPAGFRRRHSSYLQRTLAGDTGGQSPSTHRTSEGNTRGQSFSLQLSHLVDRTELDRIPPPLQRQDRVRRPDWQQRTPYTDPSRLKRPRIMPQPPHVWAPHELIYPNHLAAYQAYKRNSTGELRDVDLLEPVGVFWFHRFQTNIMKLEDTVLIPCNLGRTHWALASVDLTIGSIYLMDPFRQEVPFRHRKTQLACLRYFLQSMLHAVDFHGRKRRGDITYTLQNKPFPLNIVSRDRVPQQDRGGNCGAHTLRLIEYLVANRDTFDWLENEMGTIREKMVVEMSHLRRYSSGTLMLGPSLTIGGLEHRLLLCLDCPHLLHDCVVVLSEDEACRPSIGRPDCLFDFGFKTT
ncbi:hypothetical protein LWI28_016187 [Acer negundo]|uniref:Ubiquitin-like protease family profile domain-containing protein n=1 Tax=Acer negundo TaxID=4023 RepID=A0AAD5JTE8_ACENE|nr:hypothetical protein LWI28_016187 [Acer negundo]